MMEEYKKLLTQLVGLKSVSALPECKEDTRKTAQWLADFLSSCGFSAELFEGYGNPVMVACYVVDPNYKTCLIYGHYDVQPASIEDGWDQDPFVLTEKNNRLYGRGAMDDKGQLLAHIVSITNLIKAGKLGYNITFISEGNEEVGSGGIEKFIEDHQELLKSDFIMISDGEMVGDNPVIELGFRGMFSATLTLITSDNELHSGNYGGAAPSAPYELSKFLAGIYDEENKITIKGFYDSVDPITNPSTIPSNMEMYKKDTGTKILKTENGYDLYTQVGLRPSMSITGMHSGYVGHGYRNSIPGKAVAKLNFRLVKSQNPTEVSELFKKYVAEVMPEYVTYELEVSDLGKPVKIDLDNEYVIKAKEVLTTIYTKAPFIKYVGGSEPVAIHFADILQKPQVLVPFANSDGMMHGINENIDLEYVANALKFSMAYFEK